MDFEQWWDTHIASLNLRMLAEPKRLEIVKRIAQVAYKAGALHAEEDYANRANAEREKEPS